MEGGCCDQRSEDESRIDSNNQMSTDLTRQDGNILSTSKDVKKHLAFGIEAILGNPTKQSSNNLPQLNANNNITSELLIKEEKCEVKEEPEDEKLSHLSQIHRPVNFPFPFSHYFPLTSSSSSLSSSSSSCWSDERRSGSTSPPLQELRRPSMPSSSSSSSLSSSSSSSSSLSSSSLMKSEEEKLRRPMLPFLLPHTLSLRRHRIDRSVEN